MLFAEPQNLDFIDRKLLKTQSVLNVYKRVKTYTNSTSCM